MRALAAGERPRTGAKLRNAALVLAAYAVLFGVFGWSMFREARGQLVIVASNRIDAFRNILGRQIAASEDGMQMALELVVRNEEWVRLFAEGRRDELLDALLPLYEEALSPEYGITQFHFHRAPATSFLRLHRPEEFGDDISEWRRTIVLANEALRPVVGIEVSRSGPGLKVVQPVFHEGDHVGSVEMAARYTTLIEEIAGELALEYSVGIDEQVFEEARCADLLAIEATNRGRIFSSFSGPLVRGLLERTPLPDAPTAIETGGRTVLYSSIPIRDFDGREVGAIALVLDATDDVERLRRNLVAKLSLLAVAALLISGATLGLLDRGHKRRQLALTREWADRVEQKNAALIESQRQLEARNLFIRSTFGRYLSDEIVASLLEHPEGLKLGGEQRTVTIMMTDLRGFTSMSERLEPEDVVWILNVYLGAMTEIIQRHQGTIDEFIGDAILVIFGAPLVRDDDAERAVRCAIEMQREMDRINARIVERGLPEIEMGIGINTGEVVVGNIGSESRAKYGVVGPPVNLTARIESYTTGSQVMISQSTRDAIAEELRIADEMEVKPKGVAEPLTIYEIAGIGGERPLAMPRVRIDLRPVTEPVPVRFVVLEGKHETAEMSPGRLVRLSQRFAELVAEDRPAPLANLKIDVGAGGEMVFAKVKQLREDPHGGVILRFTSLPPKAWELLETTLAAPEADTPPRPRLDLEPLSEPWDVRFSPIGSDGPDGPEPAQLVRLGPEHGELRSRTIPAPGSRWSIDLGGDAEAVVAEVLPLRGPEAEGVLVRFTEIGESARSAIADRLRRG